MSGGVDSSVAAALLKAKGYEVIGVTMCFNLAPSNRKKIGCCSLQGIEDARRVAHKLGIKHYVLNMQKALEEKVVRNFCEEYLLGRTPNPCIVCNEYLKFGYLLERARVLDAEFLATGHYARIIKVQGTGERGQGYLLRKAKDLHKDQSYFLYRLNQEQLKHIIFPLGNYTKEEVRGLARKFKLSVAEKKASQEICFLPNDDYRAFLKARIGKEILPGPVIDSEGNIAGEHKGIAYYTIGQREGLGIAKGYPVYITRIEPKSNTIFIGSKNEALKKEFLVKDLYSSLKTPLKKKVALKVKIRYNHQETDAEIYPFAGQAKIIFKKPQFAITPGQSAVFYSRGKVLGGGIIDKVLE